VGPAEQGLKGDVQHYKAVQSLIRSNPWRLLSRAGTKSLLSFQGRLKTCDMQRTSVRQAAGEAPRRLLLRVECDIQQTSVRQAVFLPVLLA
jgi:hypothetical protein